MTAFTLLHPLYFIELLALFIHLSVWWLVWTTLLKKKKKTMQEIVNQREYVIESGKFFALAK